MQYRKYYNIGRAKGQGLANRRAILGFAGIPSWAKGLSRACGVLSLSKGRGVEGLVAGSYVLQF
jgi:hypothetical protein